MHVRGILSRLANQRADMSELDQILADIQSVKDSHALRGRWNPQQRGRIDIRIAADGDWYHEGRRIQRDALVKLFAGILRREDDSYYLVTPVEKLAIQVDDAPFMATLVERVGGGDESAIVFTTNIGERIVVDREHALRIEIDRTTGEPRPYVELYNGLEALIGRSAFYDLLNLAQEKQDDAGAYLAITSMGQEFRLGSIDE
jgi:hypothetical protein